MREKEEKVMSGKSEISSRISSRTVLNSMVGTLDGLEVRPSETQLVSAHLLYSHFFRLPTSLFLLSPLSHDFLSSFLSLSHDFLSSSHWKERKKM